MESEKDVIIDVESLLGDKIVSIEIQNLNLPEWTIDIIDSLIDLINRQLTPIKLDIEFT